MKTDDPTAPPISPRQPRWWLLAVIVSAALVAGIAIWFWPQRSQQHTNLDLAKLVLATLGAAGLWLLAFSRLRARVRLVTLLAGLVLAGALAAGFRIRGVDGNLVPIVEWRWGTRALPKPSAPPTSQLVAVPPGAADFAQFLGPNRDGVLTGPRLATDWSARPPERLWRQPIGAAWSGFAVAGGVAVTQEQRGEEEGVAAYELTTGRPLWWHADPARFTSTLAGEGPRATPTIAGSRVLAVGATGVLNCLDLTSGRVVWRKDFIKEAGGTQPDWGYSGSPLVLENVVVVNPGGGENRALMACAIADGAIRWVGGTGSPSYSSPLVTTLAGVRQILLFGSALTAHDAATGATLWSFPWPGGHPHVAMPVRLGDSDWILSSGYGTGSARLAVDRDETGQWSASEIWRTNRMKSKFANPVLHRGHLYGLDDGVLACMEVTTGELNWRDGKYGHGQVLLAGDHLLVMAEKGDVVLVDPQTDGLRELTRFAALSGKTWNPPALAGEYLVVRNDVEAACYRMPVAQ
jgi:outer membrane protein assembly factor BamB